MAYTQLTVAVPTDSGAAVAMANADTGNGNKFENDGKTILDLHNNGVAGSATVTILTGGTVDGKAVADTTVTLSTGQRKRVGPFKRSVYNVGSGDDAGCVCLTYSGAGAADVDVEAVKV